MATCSTHDKNRLRSLLPESRPAFGALTELADPRWLKMMEGLGGSGRPLRRRSRDPGREQIAHRRGCHGGGIDATVEVPDRGGEPSSEDSR